METGGGNMGGSNNRILQEKIVAAKLVYVTMTT